MRREYRKSIGGGVLPDGYVECEWIGVDVETKLLFIDTEYRPDNETGILLRFSNLERGFSHDLNFFGCKNNQTDNARFMINCSYGKIGFGFNSYVGTGDIDFNEEHTVTMNYCNDRRFNVDNGVITRNIRDTLPYMVNTIAIFSSIQSYTYNTLDGYKYKVYAVEITQGGDVVRKFVPCVRLSDMQAGMYELLGNVCSLTNTPFFTKVGGTHNFSYQLKS